MFYPYIPGEVEMTYPFLQAHGQGFLHKDLDTWVDKEWVRYLSEVPEAELAKLLDLESLRFSVGFKFSFSSGGGFGLTLKEFSDYQVRAMMDIVKYRLSYA